MARDEMIGYPSGLTEAGLLIWLLDGLADACAARRRARPTFLVPFTGYTSASEALDEVLGITDAAGQTMHRRLLAKSPAFLEADLRSLVVTVVEEEKLDSIQRYLDRVVDGSPSYVLRTSEGWCVYGLYQRRLSESRHDIPRLYLHVTDLLLQQANIQARDRTPVISLWLDAIALRDEVRASGDVSPKVRDYMLKHLAKLIDAFPDVSRLDDTLSHALGEAQRRASDLTTEGSDRTPQLRRFFTILERSLVILAASEQVLELPSTIRALLEQS